METQTLDAMLKSQGLSHSELARRVGVSRQAVSLWFKRRRANLQSRHLLKLSEVLGVPVEELVEPLPCFEPETHERLRAALLWDRLFDDLDDFAIAVNAADPRAIARLTEVYGLYQAERCVGRLAWSEFPNYRRYLHPARRKQLETLWDWHENRRAE